MSRILFNLLRRTPLRYAYNRVKALFFAGSQSNESLIIKSLVGLGPKTFIEFGFHPNEYNCIGLDDFEGLLVDGDEKTVRLARAILPKRIEVRNMFIGLDNINLLKERFPKIGVLSIDIDGNDYWMAEALLPASPEVLVVEYNATFGLKAITVPYDPTFERHQKHPSGWYHGASLVALTRLCRRFGYKLVAVSEGGGNAFFVPNSRSLPALDPAIAYRENTLRNKWSRKSAAEQWELIRPLTYVTIEESSAHA